GLGPVRGHLLGRRRARPAEAGGLLGGQARRHRAGPQPGHRTRRVRHYRQRRRPRFDHRRHAGSQRHVLRPRQPHAVRRPPPAAPPGGTRRGGRPGGLAVQRGRQRRYRRCLPRRRRHDGDMMRRTVRRRPLAPPNPADPDTPAPTPGVAGPGRVATGCADRASTAVDALRPQPVALPTGFRVALDRGARWTGDGTALIGGSPLRVLRLTPAGRDLVGRLASGEPVPPAEGAQRLARRLLDAGLAHPRPPAPAAAPDLAVVIPVHDDADGLRATLAALRRPQAAAGGSDPTGIAGRAGPTAVADDGPGVPVVVVDDASAVPVTVGAGGAGGVAIVRRARQGGPAAARNDGWRATGAELVAFVDANCEPDTGWLDTVLPHFGDPLVAAVAPRIVLAPHPAAPGWLAAYEDGGSPLDLGAGEAIVRPRSPVAYVPTAALVVRRAALEALGGFDESLTVGEDVDFVWRLAAAGWTIRYEPRATVRHPMRPTVAAWLAQRYRYGTSAAALARRHGAAVAPAVVSPRTAAAWALVAAGHPLAGASAAASSVAVLTGA